MAQNSFNPFAWVEIYVEDMSRAQKFYETVLGIKLTPMESPGDFGDLEMLCFPWAEGELNISGALCKTSDFKPGTGGTLVYFTSKDCTTELSKVEAAGGKIIQDKFSISEHGFVALAMDTEGNTIGFHSNQ
ncbi:VOC family protein [Belliella kenyensis]|uniref:VOC family protein n=1 Tax=Belliella kenyensis TaxID=1472724 RepID=A0ABV8ESU6_9BACT|nr:VOC family protein [Belliella kenyensis]MCH7402204.1 VOC family protein [Belliella kenyensis]MDN3601718.1 VOC family protein [Belliella kenyensis]